MTNGTKWIIAVLIVQVMAITTIGLAVRVSNKQDQIIEHQKEEIERLNKINRFLEIEKKAYSRELIARGVTHVTLTKAEADERFGGIQHSWGLEPGFKLEGK